MPDKIQWVYSSKNNSELSERYNQWAKDYERDLTENFGRSQREPIVDLTIKYVSKNAHILDAGVGTGIMGKWLQEEGYYNLVGIDLSPGMLAEAKKKNVYTELHQMILGEPLDFPNAAFDAVTACGVFTYGHAPSSSFDELIRVTKPEGYIIFTLRPDFYENSDFQEQMADLETQSKWQLTELGEKYQAEPQGKPDLYLQTWVYQISR
ncbi:class I SAM-dependent DNA methyltransferase [Nodularia sphaerocarpa]|uniref:class I SAM-dependent DNA methyltransferase n=1 Tax=Nodularia sphaerocarpa TaxID=137816 RepID=UPI001EFB5811|nr:class I SAM-dependent methyltransferase [Nodularia sphaerocarpa]MDB9373634.1 class I SAM-dependent methyltransferase [Nodularia sphaerocarpa CS-585]MDB9378529.1 class I SAM-dependent methyltransferase [Nodularia sphaerocarpa CS-585A2]